MSERGTITAIYANRRDGTPYVDKNGHAFDRIAVELDNGTTVYGCCGDWNRDDCELAVNGGAIVAGTQVNIEVVDDPRYGPGIDKWIPWNAAESPEAPPVEDDDGLPF